MRNAILLLIIFCSSNQNGLKKISRNDLRYQKHRKQKTLVPALRDAGQALSQNTLYENVERGGWWPSPGGSAIVLCTGEIMLTSGMCHRGTECSGVTSPG